MYYYKARIYSPTLGRFLQVDPIGYDDQVNLYAYVGNDPVNKGDPTGQSGACFETPDACGLYTKDPERIQAQINAGEAMAASTAFVGGEAAWAFRGAVLWGVEAYAAWKTGRWVDKAIAAGGRLVLYSRTAMPTLKSGDFVLDMKRGWSLKANDAAIAGAIRQGKPIRDSFLDKAGNLKRASPDSVLARERNQLLKAGWKFDTKSGEWERRAATCIGNRVPGAGSGC